MVVGELSGSEAVGALRELAVDPSAGPKRIEEAADRWPAALRTGLAEPAQAFAEAAGRERERADQLIAEFGGLHHFMDWDKPILTDSGGFQVFSLTELRKIDDEGVTFQSHLDGSKHKFTPEATIQIQRNIGSDIMMVLDECTPYPCEYDYAQKSMELTVKWAKQSMTYWQENPSSLGINQALFGILQGSVYDDLRQICAEKLIEMNFPG